MDICDIREINVIWREKICQWSYNVVDQYVILRVRQENEMVHYTLCAILNNTFSPFILF
jgi:hypothetical protein